MNDIAGSSFTDLLLNQPVLVWSLAGGISILVIAGFFSLFLAARKQAQKKQAEKATVDEHRLAEVERVQSAVTELQTIAKDDEPDEERTAVAQIPIEKVTLGGGNEENPDAATFVQTGSLGDGQAAAVTEEHPHDSGEEEEVSELAALFEAEVIVDPYVQALRDNLPEVSIEKLLTDIYAISTELQEHIEAHAATQS